MAKPSWLNLNLQQEAEMGQLQTVQVLIQVVQLEPVR